MISSRACCSTTSRTRSASASSFVRSSISVRSDGVSVRGSSEARELAISLARVSTSISVGRRSSAPRRVQAAGMGGWSWRRARPPVIVYKRQRGDYLRALRRADAGDAGLLGELMARAILDNLYKFVVPAIAGPARLVPLAALATDEVTSHALRVAAARGRLQVTRGSDGQWRSCRNWVNDYPKSLPPRGVLSNYATSATGSSRASTPSALRRRAHTTTSTSSVR